MMPPDIFWRWVTKMKNKVGSKLTKLFLLSVKQNVEHSGWPEVPEDSHYLKTISSEGPNEDRVLDQADRELLDDTFAKFSIEGAPEQVVSCGALILAHGGDLAGLLAPLESQHELDRREFNAFALDLKRQHGGPILQSLLDALRDNPDTLIDAIEAWKQEDQEPMRVVLEFFFAKQVGHDGDIVDRSVLDEAWTAVNRAFGLFGLKVDSSEVECSEEDPIDIEDFCDETETILGHFLDSHTLKYSKGKLEMGVAS